MSILSILFMFISAVLAILLPTIAAIYLNKKYKASWKAVFIGALIFIVFQPLTRFQLLKYMRSTYWFSYNMVVNPWIIYLFAGFSAGLFENVGRFIGFKFLLKDKLEWKNGIAYGIGHGGIEAILMAGIPIVAAIISSLATGIVPNQSPVMFLVGGIERVFAMTFHVGASLMVLYGIKNKKYRYLLYAILIHGILDSSIGFIKNIALVELWAAIIAFGTLGFMIYKIKKTSSEKIL